MRACITLEHRFLGTPDGRTWTITQFPYEFFKNYLEVFERVRIVARVFPVERVETQYRAVDGPGVEVFAMPPYKGPFRVRTPTGPRAPPRRIGSRTRRRRHSAGTQSSCELS